MIGAIFTAILYQPLYNVLIFIYGIAPWGGLGLGIIVMTILVRLATLPLTYKSMRAQKELQEIQPKIEEIKKKYKGAPNQEDMAKELMAVYKTHNVNPFASCLPTIVQLVVFIALFHVLSAGLKTVDIALLYPFVRNPGEISHMFLGMNLSVVSIPLGILAAAMQYLQAKQMIGKRPPKVVRQSAEGSEAMDEDMTATMNRMTLIMLPIMMLIMGVTTLPGGTTLYIFTSALITYGIYEFFLKPPAPEGPKVEVLPAPPKS
jgi:YidC/Oxa1 family membrane protein insertase